MRKTENKVSRMRAKEKNKTKYRFSTRAASILCILALLLPLYITLPARAASNDSNKGASASGSSSAMHEGIHVEMDRTVTDLKNGYYQLTYNAYTWMRETIVPEVQTFAKNGVFTATDAGYYLVELWGGKGGNGAASMQSDGGAGGSSGYIYGLIYLDAGDSLVYTIGTNGGTNTNGAGGGANEGGNVESGSYGVGGGGGYSAVYLFEGEHGADITEAERVNNYVMIAGGGGGGGAGVGLLLGNRGNADGGNGGHILDSINGSVTAENNSGVAGTWFGGTNGRSNGTSTKYVGMGATNYIGDPAEVLFMITSTGEASRTASVHPNDWIGSYENAVAPGNGGNGYLRGGAGGAGFCGGSGGTQTSDIIASNIGGGGGGSSFIAEGVIWQGLDDTVKSLLTASNSRSSVGGKLNITYIGTEENGGQIVVPDPAPYANSTATVILSQYFDVVEVRTTAGTVSYEQIAAADATDTENTKVIISDINMAPSADGGEGELLTVHVIIRPKSEFCGGNDVPLYGDTVTESKSMYTSYYNGQFTIAPDFPEGDNAGRVFNVTAMTEEEYDSRGSNVKNLDFVHVVGEFKVVTYSFSSSDNTKTYKASSLYRDDYAEARATVKNDARDWRTDFLYTLTDYRINGVVYDGDYEFAPQSTTEYTVSFTVDYYSGYDSTVGTKNEGEVIVSGTATVRILTGDEFAVYEETMEKTVTVDGGKFLTYNGSGFTFGIETKQSFAEPKDTAEVSGYYTVPYDGWYYVEAIGGGGGGADQALITRHNNQDPRIANGSDGTPGGYTGGFIHLTEGTVIRVSLGTRGANGATDLSISEDRSFSTSPNLSTGGTAVSNAGKGGTPTLVYINDTLAMAAGGGGGASGAVVSGGSSWFAQSSIWGSAGWDKVVTHHSNLAESSVDYYTVGTVEALYDETYTLKVATDGTNGSGWNDPCNTALTKSDAGATAGTVGQSTPNYISDMFYQPDENGELPAFVSSTYKDSQTLPIRSTKGRVAVSCIITDDALIAADLMKIDFEAEGAITRYFNVSGIGMDVPGSTYTESAVADGYTERVYFVEGAGGATVEIGKLSYKLTPMTDANGDPYTYFYIKDVHIPVESTKTEVASKTTFLLSLDVAEGFIGGNDVPVLVDGVLGHDGTEQNPTAADMGVKIRWKGSSMFLEEHDESDYANVPISFTFPEDSFVTLDSYELLGSDTLYPHDLIIRDELTLPSGEEAWKSEFVKVVHQSNTPITITENTTIKLSQQVAPIADAQKATITDSVAAVKNESSIKITKLYNVEKVLENVIAVGPDSVEHGSELVVYLMAEDGYELSEVTVEIGGISVPQELFAAYYSNGELRIPAEAVVASIKITARATKIKYKLTYTYVDVLHPEGPFDPTNTLDGLRYSTHTEYYESEQAIDYTWFDSLNATIEAMMADPQYSAMVEGYDYIWDGAIQADVTQRLDVMPAQDVTVLGTIRPKLYELTVSYYIQGEIAPFSVHTENVQYTADYRVDTPALEGYYPDIASVTGTMGTADVAVDVTYIPNPEYSLNVFYFYADGNTATPPAAQTFTYSPGEAYSVVPPSITGYTPDPAVIEGNSIAEGGLTVYVYYRPNTYRVTYNAGVGAVMLNSTVDADGNTVFVGYAAYNNIFGYDPNQDTYGGLPQPYLENARFLGWTTQPYEVGTDVDTIFFVTEESMYYFTSDTTLYAFYEVREYVVTIKYVDEYGNELAPSVSGAYPTGSVVPYAPITIEGKICTDPAGSVTVGNSNVVITFVYYDEMYAIQLRVYMYDETKGTYSPSLIPIDGSYDNLMNGGLLNGTVAYLKPDTEYSFENAVYTLSTLGAMLNVKLSRAVITAHTDAALTDATYVIPDEKKVEFTGELNTDFAVLKQRFIGTVGHENLLIELYYDPSTSYNLSLVFLDMDRSTDSSIVTLKDTYMLEFEKGDMIDLNAVNEAIGGLHIEGYVSEMESEWNYLLEYQPMVDTNDFFDSEGTQTTTTLPIPYYKATVTYTISTQFIYSNKVLDSTLVGTKVAEDMNIVCSGTYIDDGGSEPYWIGSWITLDGALPQIEHYHADINTLMGGGVDEEGNPQYPSDLSGMPAPDPMGMEVIPIVIYYDPNIYTLKINYMYSSTVGDETLAGTAIDELTVEVSYAYDPNRVPQVYMSPTVSGYTPDIEYVFFEFVADGEYTVQYVEEGEQIISVTVSFGSMVFDFTAPRWDPENHIYTSSIYYGGEEIVGLIPPYGFDGTSMSSLNNTISVQNNGTGSIRVGLSYELASDPSGDYELMGLFTDSTLDPMNEDMGVGPAEATLSSSQSGMYLFWLLGHANLSLLEAMLSTMPNGTTGLPVGTITVTITAAG